MRIPKDTSRLLYVCVLATVCAIYAAMVYLTPLIYDNLWFESIYLSFSNGSDAFDAAAFADYAEFMRTHDNWRLANLLAPLTSLVFPCRTLFALLSGVCIAYMVYAVSDAFSRSRRLPAAVAMWALVAVFAPWRDSILVNDYALNYIYPSALFILLYRIAVSLMRSLDRGKAVLLVILSVPAALWHEGFSISAGGALMLYILLFRRGKAPAAIWASVLILIAGGAGWAYSSQLLHRAHRELTAPAIAESPALSVFNNCLSVALALFAMVSCVFRRLRTAFRRALGCPLFTLFFLSALIACAISFTVGYSIRTAFWPQVCAAGAIVLWTRGLDVPISRNALRAATLTLAALLSVHGLHVIYYIHKASSEYDHILAEYKHPAPYGTVYADITMPEEYPPTLLGYPTRIIFVAPFSYRVLDTRYPDLHVAVVPTALRSIGYATPDTLGRAMRIGDALFCDTVASEGAICRARLAALDLRMRDGTTRTAQRTFVLRFTAPDGRQYLYLKPYKTAAADIDEVTAITPLPD